ncbi:hypothetical protein ACX3O0_07460 [Homoserinimonas sp. A447]|jgi:hypothetical protein
MARHREITTWKFSRARHRAPGSVEQFVQRGRHALIVSLASVVLATALVTWDPAFEQHI